MYELLTYNNYYTVKYIAEYFRANPHADRSLYLFHVDELKSAVDPDVKRYDNSDLSNVLQCTEGFTILNGSLQTAEGSALSGSKDAILTTNYEDDYTVKGTKFHSSEVLSFSGAETKYFLIDLSNVDEDKFNYILPFTIDTKSEDVEVYVYRAPTITTLGTAQDVPFYNCNEYISDDYQFDVKTGNAADFNMINEGLQIRHFTVFASSGFFGITSSGSGSSSDPLILNNQRKYLIKMISAGTTIMNYDADIFEF